MILYQLRFQYAAWPGDLIITQKPLAYGTQDPPGLHTALHWQASPSLPPGRLLSWAVEPIAGRPGSLRQDSPTFKHLIVPWQQAEQKAACMVTCHGGKDRVPWLWALTRGRTAAGLQGRHRAYSPATVAPPRCFHSPIPPGLPGQHAALWMERFLCKASLPKYAGRGEKPNRNCLNGLPANYGSEVVA